MRKLLLRGGVFSLALTVTLVACKKETIQMNNSTENQKAQSAPESTVSYIEKMMVFKTVGDYEVLANDLEENRVESLQKIEAMEFTSYKESTNNEKSATNVLGDDFLASILNKDFIVQIGSYLYKINKSTEKVFVLPVANIKQYADLVNENKTNKNIRQFSTEDNVLELAVSGASGEKALVCKDDGVASRSQTVISASSTSPSGVVSTLVHIKYGIYFTLKTQSATNDPYGGTFIYEFSNLGTEGQWRVRCGSWGSVAGSSWVSLSPTMVAKYDIHHSSTNYNKYNLKARCKYFLGATTESKYLKSVSAWMQIRVNL